MSVCRRVTASAALVVLRKEVKTITGDDAYEI